MKTTELKKRYITLVLVACGLLLAATVWAQQVKKTSQADIRSDKFTYDWSKSEFLFTGNCRVEIKGPDKAVMTAPRMIGKLAAKGQQIDQISAVGPVKFDIITAADSQGVQRRIVATCTGQAIYEGASSIVTLNGGAEAQMTTIPAQADEQPTKFTGSKLIVNFKRYTVEGEGVHFEVEVPSVEDEPVPAPVPAPTPVNAENSGS